jgi:hypothetical protein
MVRLASGSNQYKTRVILPPLSQHHQPDLLNRLAGDVPPPHPQTVPALECPTDLVVQLRQDNPGQLTHAAPGPQ